MRSLEFVSIRIMYNCKTQRYLMLRTFRVFASSIPSITVRDFSFRSMIQVFFSCKDLDNSLVHPYLDYSLVVFFKNFSAFVRRCWKHWSIGIFTIFHNSSPPCTDHIFQKRLVGFDQVSFSRTFIFFNCLTHRRYQNSHPQKYHPNS